jgi:ABC-type transport system involved in multi-copper enzyme maturation permease subunit
MTGLFAILVIERNPLQPSDLLNGAFVWVQVVGVLAALGLAIAWLLAAVRGRSAAATMPLELRLALAVAGVLYLASAALWLIADDSVAARAAGPASLFFTLGSACALIGVGLPFARALTRLRPRRVWALARLSIKEAIRRRVLWAYLVLVLVFLFGSWFLPHKPEDQVRTYVQVVYGAMAPLLLITAGLLAAFSIPTDVQNQTIHTVVTKPVERFEIVLGRFLGLTVLMTGVLAVLSVVSLGYVWKGVDPGAAAESMRARVPIYGELQFVRGERTEGRGVSVGRVWKYRSFIAGGRDSTHRAVWGFRDLPADLASRDAVPCEFEFDIAHFGKSRDEDKGVGCTLKFETWRYDPGKQAEYQAERDRQKLDAGALDRLAEKYGIYEDSRVVVNKRVFAIPVPGGLFRNALADGAPPPGGVGREPPEGGTPTAATGAPLLRVVVKCEDESQYLGVARYDLYLLEAEGSFGANFLKGAMGLWFRLVWVIGVALACSTGLSGVISWLTAMFLYGMGLFEEFIRDLALGTRFGTGGQRKVSGPAESLLSLFNPQGEAAPAAVASFDEAFRWFLRRFLSVIPNVDLFDWTEHVAEGFDISWLSLALNLVVLAAYLLPWFVLAYYLMRSREIAA